LTKFKQALCQVARKFAQLFFEALGVISERPSIEKRHRSLAAVAEV